MHHDEFYSQLKIPGSGVSCCNNKDCRPADYRITLAGVEFLIGGKWIKVPQKRVMEILTPDGKGHWCGIDRESHTFCAIVPLGGV